MIETQLEVTITVQAPILTKATGMGAHGVDAGLARDAQDNYMLPYSLIKGKLRDAWTDWKEAAPEAFDADIDALLGTETGGPSRKGGPPPLGVAPRRSRLTFTDFSCQAEGSEEERSYRIRVDPDTGSVQKGAFLVMEAPFAPGKEVSFSGQVRFWAKDATEAAAIERWVRKGLEWTASYGADRSTGLGRTLSVSVQQVQDKPAAAEAATGAEFLTLEIRPLSPFCFASRRATDNLFESESVIPGGVIKGALAATWLELLGKPGDTAIAAGLDPNRRELAENFHRVRFTHAFPAADGKRPVAVPLSTVQVKGQTEDRTPPFYDVALRETEGPINGRAPAFAVDWKDDSKIREYFGWDPLKRELRVRTAIDRDKLKAKDEKLFAMETVVPEDHAWLATADLTDIADKTVRANAEAQLRGLLAIGLRNLGKTKAVATVTVAAAPAAPCVPSTGGAMPGNLWVVTLQTPALLCDPRQLHESSTAAELKAAYQDTWSALSKDLTLVRYFARQELAGGYYLRNRFQHGAPYRPFLLTSAGSVFVFQGDAGSKLRDWVTKGLPPAPWVCEVYGRGCKEDDLWKYCPYIRENGYGEIAVNLKTHVTAQPGGE